MAVVCLFVLRIATINCNDSWFHKWIVLISPLCVPSGIFCGVFLSSLCDPIGQPTFSVEPVVPLSLSRRVTVAEGQNVIMKCNVVGGGGISISGYRWWWCGSTGCVVLQTQTGRSLRFMPVKQLNAGVYECDDGQDRPRSKGLKLVVNRKAVLGKCKIETSGFHASNLFMCAVPTVVSDVSNVQTWISPTTQTNVLKHQTWIPLTTWAKVLKQQTGIPPTSQAIVTPTQAAISATSTVLSSPTISEHPEPLAEVTIPGTELSVTDDKQPSEITHVIWCECN